MIALQAARALALTAAAAWLVRAGQRLIASHITTGAEPDLVGFTIWLVFVTLGSSAVGRLSWVVTVAPLLDAEGCGVSAALSRSFKLRRAFTAKLVEINMVMGIVKLALMVLAMVFSSVLIPFAEEVGASALHMEWLVVAVFYFVANDYFQLVRLKGFIEFWKRYRSNLS